MGELEQRIVSLPADMGGPQASHWKRHTRSNAIPDTPGNAGVPLRTASGIKRAPETPSGAYGMLRALRQKWAAEED
jgi:hypothetical protein